MTDEDVAERAYRAAEALVERRGDVGLHRARTALQFTRRASQFCSECGQGVPVPPGPVDWLDNEGRSQGGWSHQHGCGAWNSPQEVILRLDEEDGEKSPEERVEGALAALDRLVADERAALRADLRASVEENADDAVKRLGEVLGREEKWEGEREDALRDIATGSEFTPGVYIDADTGVLVSWAYGFETTDGVVDEIVDVERELPAEVAEKVREVLS